MCCWIVVTAKYLTVEMEQKLPEELKKKKSEIQK